MLIPETDLNHDTISAITAGPLLLLKLVRLVPKCRRERREAVSRVEDRKGQRCNENHHTVQDNELGLILHNLVAPSTAHLGDTVDAAGEDCHVGDKEGAHEEAEAGILGQLARGRREGVAALVHADHVFDEEAAEDDQHNDLENYTGEHEVGAGLEHAGARVGGRGGSATGALQDEREDVAADEDACIPHGLEAGVLLAEGEHEVLESQIDAGGDKCGRENEADDLHVEAGRGEGVVVHDDAASVTSNFSQTAESHGKGIGPCFRICADGSIEDKAGSKYGEEEGIGWK